VTKRLDALLLIAAVLLFIPTWLWLGEAWISDPYYSHGPLVLIISLYLIWVRRKVLDPARAVPSNLGWPLIAIALAVHLWATVWHAYYISALMIPLVLFGLVVTFYGWRSAIVLLFPLAFLLLMVPLPLAERFGPALEGWTAMGATAIARFIGVAAQNQGSEVFLPNSTFTVGIPCGGLRSAVAIITLAALVAYIAKGNLGARALILLAAIPIALAANTFRIALLFAIANVWGAQTAMDYFHNISSPLLFAVAFILLLLLARGLRCSEVRWEVVIPQ
jgi:exosortase